MQECLDLETDRLDICINALIEKRTLHRVHLLATPIDACRSSRGNTRARLLKSRSTVSSPIFSCNSRIRSRPSASIALSDSRCHGLETVAPLHFFCSSCLSDSPCHRLETVEFMSLLRLSFLRIAASVTPIQIREHSAGEFGILSKSARTTYGL